MDDELAAAIDELVASGAVASRSDAVRIGLVRLVEENRRHLVGQQIVAGYTEFPQVGSDTDWSDASTLEMISEEPW